MHPPDFVRIRITEGKTNEIVDAIHAFRSKLNHAKTDENASVFNFANLFLISVAGQLRRLGPDQNLRDDRLLVVWAELGYFGIERDQIEDDSEE